MSFQETNKIWFELLTNARKTASEDLRLSNDILQIVSSLVELQEVKELDGDKVQLIAKSLVDAAVKLSDHSSQSSRIVAKLMGLK